MTGRNLMAAIVNRNSGPNLCRVVHDLARELPAENIVVIDNDSFDNSLSDLPGGVVVRRFPQNAGYVPAANSALFEAYRRGVEFLLLVNPDVWFEREAVEQIARIMEQNLKAGAIFVSVLRRSEPGISDGSVGSFHRRSVLIGLPDEGKTVLPLGPPFPVDFGHGCFSMWRVRPLCRAGGFDARLFAYHDEADGCLKLKNRGYRCLLAPSVRVSHQGHATGSPSFLAKQYLIARNSILLARTHFPRYTLGRVLFFALLYLGASRLFPKSVDRKIAHMRVAGWFDGMISRGVRSAVRKLLLLPTEGS